MDNVEAVTLKLLVLETLAEGMARWTGGATISDEDIQPFRELPSTSYHAERIAAAIAALPSRDAERDAEARVVAWLRSAKGSKLTLRERLVLSWLALRHGDLVFTASRIAAANFIERGEHIDEADAIEAGQHREAGE